MLVGSTQAAQILGISGSYMRKLLLTQRVCGAFKIGRNWAIPLTDGIPQVKEGTRGPKPRWKPARKAAITCIHVNQHKIRQNNKREEKEPVISVKHGSSNRYGFEAEIAGPSRVVYRPDKPLSCGAKVWIETLSSVELLSG
ncbi:DNA-binding protein [Phormidium sp. CCY1219]|nr:DNA-binding protein [Phormidium sp. CCY1219]